jgi:predicted DNA-binding transcriptional regulator AlpA
MDKPDRFILIPEICHRLGGVHPSTIYRNSGKGDFPELMAILPNRSGLWESIFENYLRSRPKIGARREKIARMRSARTQAPKRGRSAKTAAGSDDAL